MQSLLQQMPRFLSRGNLLNGRRTFLLARNFISTTFSQIAGIILSFLGTLLLARMLGADLQGTYSLAILLPSTIYFLSMFGLPTSYIVYSGKLPEKRGVIAFQGIIFSAFIYFATLCFYIITIVLQPNWFKRFETVGIFNLFLASTLVFLEMATGCLRSGILGANRILTANVASLLQPFLKVFLLFIFVYLIKWGVTGGIISQIGGFVIAFFYLIYATAQCVPFKEWALDLPFFWKSLKIGIKFQLDHISWYVVQIIDRYMIVYLIPNSNSSLGQYTIASQIAHCIWILPQALQVSFLPHLSVTKSNKSVVTTRISRILIIVLFFILLIFVIFSKFIPYIFGSDYTASVAPFLMFLPGMLIFGATRPFDSFLTHSEKPIYGVFSSMIGAALNSILNYFMILRYGITGAALATSISYIVMGCFTTCCFLYETQLSPKNLIIQKSDLKDISGVFINLAKSFNH